MVLSSVTAQIQMNEADVSIDLDTVEFVGTNEEGQIVTITMSAQTYLALKRQLDYQLPSYPWRA